MDPQSPVQPELRPPPAWYCGPRGITVIELPRAWARLVAKSAPRMWTGRVRARLFPDAMPARINQRESRPMQYVFLPLAAMLLATPAAARCRRTAAGGEAGRAGHAHGDSGLQATSWARRAAAGEQPSQRDGLRQRRDSRRGPGTDGRDLRRPGIARPDVGLHRPDARRVRNVTTAS